MSAPLDITAYLQTRITKRDYRGPNIGQQNRLPEDKLVAILKCIHGVVGTKTFRVPPGDDGPNRPVGYSEYDAILAAIAADPTEGVSATFNSLKKNHFPNLRSMGLMEWAGKSGGTARLTDTATRIVLAGPGITRTSLIGNSFQTLFESKAPGFLDRLYRLLDEHSLLNVHEIMLIVSDTSLTEAEHSALIRAYRRLKPVARLNLHAQIEELCAATMSGNKVDKRDWGNWWNQAKQIVSMLKLVPAFNVYNDEQVMKAGSAAVIAFIPKRSSKVKSDALVWHGVAPRDGWDLHHIYPIEYATSETELKKIDVKENLLYIPRDQHQNIPNKGNRSVRLTFDATNVALINPAATSGDPKVLFVRPREVVGADDRLAEMREYNDLLLSA